MNILRENPGPDGHPGSGAENAKLICLSPAKINLFLHVQNRRPDGYHDILSLISAVGIFDGVTLLPGPSPTRVHCRAPGVPEDETNLAHRAADVFFRHLDAGAAGPARGVEIHLKKQIPVGAGLGGGSSNAATVLSGLNRWYGHPFSPSDLAEMAKPLGADVPFFLEGKPALAFGIGDRLTPFSGLSPWPVVIVYPQVSVSTARVYQNFKFGLTKCKNPIKDTSFITDFNLVDYLWNDLESVTESWYPIVSFVKSAIRDCGARGVLMSGSGSSVFGLFEDDRAARRAWVRLSGHNQWRVFQTRLLV